MSSRPTPPESPSAANWRDPRHRLGLLGEQVAIAYLRKEGWQIEGHRFRIGRHDLDLVARLGHLVAFIEVKTRLGAGYGAGREAIGWRKRRTLARLGACWMERYGQPTDEYRFDVIEVSPDRRGNSEAGRRRWRVQHYPDAWRCSSLDG